ncbi:MAG: hypothetical protein N4A68_13910 [Maledivibacter sp.]|jgi:hypothetical protein|nr:hypothetical protein [Maledivibacter sp.]
MGNFYFSKTHCDRVLEYIRDIQNDATVKNLFKECMEYGDLYLIGGCIKDIAFFNKKPKDIDLVIDSSVDTPIRLRGSEKLDIKRNYFNGNRVSYKMLRFDIFNCYDLLDNIHKAARFNVDCILINLSTGDYNADIYNQGVDSGEIRIIPNSKPDWIDYYDHRRGIKLQDTLKLSFDYALFQKASDTPHLLLYKKQ